MELTETEVWLHEAGDKNPKLVGTVENIQASMSKLRMMELSLGSTVVGRTSAWTVFDPTGKPLRHYFSELVAGSYDEISGPNRRELMPRPEQSAG